MSTIDILLEIKKLPILEQLIVVEKTLRSIRVNDMQTEMRSASNRSQNDYETDAELTAFTALDSEPVYESM